MSRQPSSYKPQGYRQVPDARSPTRVPVQQGSSPLNPFSQSTSSLQHDTSSRESANSQSSSISDHRNAAQGVATGQVGAGYGPYAYTPVDGPQGSRPRMSSLPGPASSRDSHAAPRNPFAGGAHPPSSSGHSSSPRPTPGRAGMSGMAPGAAAMWTAKDAEMDDKLHNTSPHDVDRERYSWNAFSLRGWLNMTAIVILVGALITVFGAYPIISFYQRKALSNFGAYNVGGINSTGQVPDIPGLPSLIDKDTPASALTRTGRDGARYVLAFSDEFNVDGRTFWPGDDPFWEAVNIHYWPTGDYEWYDPDGAVTRGGNLEFTITQEPINGLNFRSGMITTWNKFCFTGGYIETRVMMPGSPVISGLWPGAWTMGNLGRAGFGATNDGNWPFSYGACDVGTMPNQTNIDGVTPVGATVHGGYGGYLSYQPGQRLSACTCPGEQHPGPSTSVGRGAPEIDIFEAQISWDGGFRGSVSQSVQFAPYDFNYTSVETAPQTVVYDAETTYLNDYKGGPYQQAISGVSYTNQRTYELGGAQYATYGYENYPGSTPGAADGYITWYQGGEAMWTMTAAAVGPNAQTQISQRLISVEPMYIILNLGMSASFQTINWAELVFPAVMRVDYVRVYQREDSPNIGCDPPNYPTADYIQNHLDAYLNANLTTWEAAGYPWPRNRLVETC